VGVNPQFDPAPFIFQLKGAEHVLVFMAYDDNIGPDDMVGGYEVSLQKLDLEHNADHPNLVLPLGSGKKFEKPTGGSITVSIHFKSTDQVPSNE
jgi:hypothetical protein